MRPQDVVSTLREDIELTQRAGHELLDPVLLLDRLKVIDRWIDEDGPFDAERAASTRQQLQINFEVAQDTARKGHEWDMEMFRTVIGYGQSTLKASLLVTGGGAAALLAFLGHLVSTGATRYVVGIAESLMWMVWAVIASALAVAATYLTQWLFAKGEDSKWWRWTGWAQLAVYLLFLGSIGLFAYGAWLAHLPFIAAS